MDVPKWFSRELDQFVKNTGSVPLRCRWDSRVQRFVIDQKHMLGNNWIPTLTVQSPETGSFMPLDGNAGWIFRRLRAADQRAHYRHDNDFARQIELGMKHRETDSDERIHRGIDDITKSAMADKTIVGAKTTTPLSPGTPATMRPVVA